MDFPSTFTDQMGHTISLAQPPLRIISLVPSQTELLYDLGLDEEIVGITKFCIHPEEWFRTKTRIGGTKQFHFDKIDVLKPDLILGNKEENEEVQIHRLQESYPVWMSDIHNLDEAMKMIAAIGEITGKEKRADEIIGSIRANFDAMKVALQNVKKRSAVYFIWRNPYMTAGKNTFIDSMMQELHLENVMVAERYPEVTLHELRELQPEVVLLSSEPYPFSEKHIDEIRSAVPDAAIQLVDGEMFSWYGSRLVHAPGYFEKLLVELGK
ncbi:MAG TPA: helical backbone metal receptor [Bacteroidia bacterium]|nr:helical backbone metal receptor [Bacteroidia bacterium]